MLYFGHKSENPEKMNGMNEDFSRLIRPPSHLTEEWCFSCNILFLSIGCRVLIVDRDKNKTYRVKHILVAGNVNSTLADFGSTTQFTSKECYRILVLSQYAK